MKVLIATSTFPLSENDGRPRFVYDLARALAQWCRVTVLAPHHPGAPHEEFLGPLKIVRFQYSWPARTQRLAYGFGMRENFRRSRLAKVQAPVYLAAFGYALRKLLRRDRFHLINSHWLVPQALGAALALGRRTSLAHVVTAHAGDVHLLEKMNLGRPLARLIAARTDMFLPVSRHVGRGLRNLVGTGPALAVQPMGVDYDRFSVTPEPSPVDLPFNGDFMLFIGRLVEKKGLICLLQALHLLKRQEVKAGLAVAGDGILQEPLRKRVKQWGLQDRVKFVGRIGHEALLHYLHGCKVVVIPSIVDGRGETDGMPTVLAEAMSAGCRVVASRVGGIPDILVEGYNGWLARPGDAQDLADKIRLALGHDQPDMAEHARRTARDLDWRRIARNYRNHFHVALDNRRKTRGWR